MLTHAVDNNSTLKTFKQVAKLPNKPIYDYELHYKCNKCKTYTALHSIMQSNQLKCNSANCGVAIKKAKQFLCLHPAGEATPSINQTAFRFNYTLSKPRENRRTYSGCSRRIHMQTNRQNESEFDQFDVCNEH